MTRVLFSDDGPRLDWSEARTMALIYGPKGAACLALPRKWTPPFVLLSSDMVGPIISGSALADLLPPTTLQRIIDLAPTGGRLIVRSSVIGETIWDRGTYLVRLLPNAANIPGPSRESLSRDQILSTWESATANLLSRSFALGRVVDRAPRAPTT